MNSTLVESTVGELVVERPSRARVFEKLGIDYCCGGRKALRQAIQENGLEAGAVVAELERESSATSNPREHNWATASMTALCDHIEQTHHAYLKEELPRLVFLTQKVADVHGGRHPHLREVHEVLVALKDELESHMMKEEQILFPLCRSLDTAEELPASHCGSVANPIAVMFREHDDAGDALARLRKLTDNYTLPADACNTYRAMFDALQQMEQDLHQHIHLENNILFPAAVRMEKRLSR